MVFHADGFDPDLRPSAGAELLGGEPDRAAFASHLLRVADGLVWTQPTGQMGNMGMAVSATSTQGAQALQVVLRRSGALAETSGQGFALEIGFVVESGAVENIFSDPSDDYTRKLLSAALDS